MAKQKAVTHIKNHERQGVIARYIRSASFGFNDGLVSTIVFLAGITGAIKSGPLILFVGIIAAFGAATSMFLGEYISTKSQQETYLAEKKRESREVEEMPEEERAEIRSIYSKMGYSGKKLEDIVKTITSDKKLWIDTMMKYELGLTYESGAPWRKASVMFVVFMIGALIPLTPFALMPPITALEISISLSLIIAFIGGAAKTRVTMKNPLTSGLELSAIAGIGIIITYYIGSVVSQLISI